MTGTHLSYSIATGIKIYDTGFFMMRMMCIRYRALKSIYEMKCALLDKIVNFGTQIVKIFLYRNFDGSKLVRPVFSRHLMLRC